MCYDNAQKQQNEKYGLPQRLQRQRKSYLTHDERVTVEAMTYNKRDLSIRQDGLFAFAVIGGAL